MEHRTVPRMRTMQQAYEAIKKEDPDTCLTLHRLKMLVRSGHIPYTKAGKKYLINLDMLFERLASGEIFDLGEPAKQPGIRALK